MQIIPLRYLLFLAQHQGECKCPTTNKGEPMQVEIDPKTNTMTIKVSINPNSEEISTSGKSFMWASEVHKLEYEKKGVRVQVNVGTPVKPEKKRK